MAQQPYGAEASLLSRIHDHIQTQHTQQDFSGRVISLTQRSLPDNTQHSQGIRPCPPAGFESTIPASELPQTHALDRSTTGIDKPLVYVTHYKLQGVRI